MGKIGNFGEKLKLNLYNQRASILYFPVLPFFSLFINLSLGFINFSSTPSTSYFHYLLRLSLKKVFRHFFIWNYNRERSKWESFASKSRIFLVYTGFHVSEFLYCSFYFVETLPALISNPFLILDNVSI